VGGRHARGTDEGAASPGVLARDQRLIPRRFDPVSAKPDYNVMVSVERVIG